MPPFQLVRSTAQRKKLFALADRGEISKDEAEGKARAAKGRDLPEYVKAAPKPKRVKSRGAFGRPLTGR